MSKIRKGRDVKASKGRRRPKSSGAANKKEAKREQSPDRRSVRMESPVSEDRVTTARQRISEGFYDRDEVRRAIAEALVFVLGARRG